MGQVILRQPIAQARRQQQILLREVIPVSFRHAAKLAYPSCEFQYKSAVRVEYSDTLLALALVSATALLAKQQASQSPNPQAGSSPTDAPLSQQTIQGCLQR